MMMKPVRLILALTAISLAVSVAPPATVAEAALTVRIAPRIGPMQGVQPKANATPST